MISPFHTHTRTLYDQSISQYHSLRISFITRTIILAPAASSTHYFRPKSTVRKVERKAWPRSRWTESSMRGDNVRGAEAAAAPAATYRSSRSVCCLSYCTSSAAPVRATLILWKRLKKTNTKRHWGFHTRGTNWNLEEKKAFRVSERRRSKQLLSRNTLFPHQQRLLGLFLEIKLQFPPSSSTLPRSWSAAAGVSPTLSHTRRLYPSLGTNTDGSFQFAHQSQSALLLNNN